MFLHISIANCLQIIEKKRNNKTFIEKCFEKSCVRGHNWEEEEEVLLG